MPVPASCHYRPESLRILKILKLIMKIMSYIPEECANGTLLSWARFIVLWFHALGNSVLWVETDCPVPMCGLVFSPPACLTHSGFWSCWYCILKHHHLLISSLLGFDPVALSLFFKFIFNYGCASCPLDISPLLSFHLAQWLNLSFGNKVSATGAASMKTMQ